MLGVLSRNEVTNDGPTWAFACMMVGVGEGLGGRPEMFVRVYAVLTRGMDAPLPATVCTSLG